MRCALLVIALATRGIIRQTRSQRRSKFADSSPVSLKLMNAGDRGKQLKVCLKGILSSTSLTKASHAEASYQGHHPEIQNSLRKPILHTQYSSEKTISLVSFNDHGGARAFEAELGRGRRREEKCRTRESPSCSNIHVCEVIVDSVRVVSIGASDRKPEDPLPQS